MINENIKIKIRNRITWLCKKMFITGLYESNVGIKCLNQIISSDMFENYATDKIKTISVDRLYLSFDGLTDKNTLLETPLLHSPHYDLVKRIHNKIDISNSEYVIRRCNGTLDFLPPTKLTPKNLELFKEKFIEKKRIIISDQYNPIKVGKFNNKYYIADGKHTAATCALLGIPPKCTVVNFVFYDSFYYWVNQKMVKSNRNYMKHIKWSNYIRNDNKT